MRHHLQAKRWNNEYLPWLMRIQMVSLEEDIWVWFCCLWIYIEPGEGQVGTVVKGNHLLLYCYHLNLPCHFFHSNATSHDTFTFLTISFTLLLNSNTSTCFSTYSTPYLHLQWYFQFRPPPPLVLSPVDEILVILEYLSAIGIRVPVAGMFMWLCFYVTLSWHKLIDMTIFQFHYFILFPWNPLTTATMTDSEYLPWQMNCFLHLVVSLSPYNHCISTM